MVPTNYNYSSIFSDLMAGNRNREGDVMRGFLAGAIGGLIATGIKTLAEHYFPVRPPATDSPPEIIAEDVAEAVADTTLTRAQQVMAGDSMHWVFGTLIGGAYGAAVEVMPQFGEGLGLPFGTAVFGIMHEGLLPAMSVEPAHADRDEDGERNELLTHLLYGFATEAVRGQVRPLLDGD